MRSADLHFHLLPGVDDGPADLLESLELARGAVAEGTETVVATPHFRFDLGTVDAAEVVHRVCELRAHLAAFSVPLEIRCGAELGHDVVESLSQYELQLLAQGPPDAPWLLVEAPFEGFGADFHAATAELRERGFGVLVAHPERSADATLDGSHGLRRELEAGSLAQVNAQSLTGEHGQDARAAAWRLIADGLVAAVASDAHGPTRPPALRAARRALLEGGVTNVTAELLIRVGPCELLQRGIHPRTAVAA
jgi:protein-tyrosine phosphatase